MINQVVRDFLPAKYFRPFKSKLVTSFYDEDKGLLFRLYDDDCCSYEEVEMPISSEFSDVFPVEHFDKFYHNPNCDYRVAFGDTLYHVYCGYAVAKEEL